MNHLVPLFLVSLVCEIHYILLSYMMVRISELLLPIVKSIRLTIVCVFSLYATNTFEILVLRPILDRLIYGR